jgi:hypothetical protein
MTGLEATAYFGDRPKQSLPFDTALRHDPAEIIVA